MAKPKTIMDMTPQELLKMFVASVGEMIDARAKTTETLIKAHVSAEIKASEARLNERIATEIKASEERIRVDMATKKDVRTAEAIISHKFTRVFERLDNHKKRIEKLEEDQLSTHKN